MAEKKTVIEVQGTNITILRRNEDDFISLTDIARASNADEIESLIRNWLRNRNTIEFLGVWERLYNPNFKPLEFEGFKMQAGLNSFAISPKQWVEQTGAIGIISKPGRYGGGTFAHKDIAFEFASWISVEFRLYLIKEFQRLKEDENQRLTLEWNLNRVLSKLNYRIHTDAIKTHLIPAVISREQASIIYASEADVLNMALFGRTARQWHVSNPNLEGNMRDYATVEQLLVLANIESMNAEFIKMGIPQGERLTKLNQIAISQMHILTQVQAARQINAGPNIGKDKLA